MKKFEYPRFLMVGLSFTLGLGLAAQALADDQLCKRSSEIQADASFRMAQAEKAYLVQNPSVRIPLIQGVPPQVIGVRQRLAQILENFRSHMSPDNRQAFLAFGFLKPISHTSSGSLAEALAANPTMKQTADLMQSLWAPNSAPVCRSGYNPVAGPVDPAPVGTFINHIGDGCLRPGKPTPGSIVTALPDITRSIHQLKSSVDEDGNNMRSNLRICEVVRFHGEHQLKVCADGVIPQNRIDDANYPIRVVNKYFIDGVPVNEGREAYMRNMVAKNCEGLREAVSAPRAMVVDSEDEVFEEKIVVIEQQPTRLVPVGQPQPPQGPLIPQVPTR